MFDVSWSSMYQMNLFFDENNIYSYFYNMVKSCYLCYKLVDIVLEDIEAQHGIHQRNNEI